jgi:phospholipase C
MNGFIVGEKTKHTMGYFDGEDIPYYWDYALNYVIDDNFFSSEMGSRLGFPLSRTQIGLNPTYQT